MPGTIIGDPVEAGALDAVISHISRIDGSGWTEGPAAIPHVHEASLEQGDVLFAPTLAFAIAPSELDLFSPAVAAASKNVSFDARTGRLAGTSLTGAARAALEALVARFSREATGLVHRLLPAYRDALVVGRSSFRPVEIAGRPSSWRKDDTRLHVDSFPATPVHGRRILRVFSNVNPHGRARSWRVGDDFETTAQRFLTSLRLPLPGLSTLLRWLRVTRTRRSPYDALMLQLHDRMKADRDYQSSTPQAAIDFPAGSTWVAFTDQVSHAAMAGQFQLEQTFLVAVTAMLDEGRSPLRILERLTGRRLV